MPETAPASAQGMILSNDKARNEVMYLICLGYCPQEFPPGNWRGILENDELQLFTINFTKLVGETNHAKTAGCCIRKTID